MWRGVRGLFTKQMIFSFRTCDDSMRSYSNWENLHLTMQPAISHDKIPTKSSHDTTSCEGDWRAVYPVNRPSEMLFCQDSIARETHDLVFGNLLQSRIAGDSYAKG